ncbi:hypothetical protein MO973_19550 [Paenibacillus sp. TRM 82003]|nr:hypothetical protein [Paenibacillus sp. TRM 82003]
MGRMDIKGSETKTLTIPRFDGINTAVSFSQIGDAQSPDMLNCLPSKIGSLGKRSGTKPLTTTALVDPIKTLCNLRAGGTNSILASAGTTLYKYASGALTAQTMTVALNRADIDAAQFKDHTGAEVLVIADGAALKYYNGTAVNTITPAADDASPLPKNDLATINTGNPPLGCIVHNTRVVIWDGSDQIWHSKPGYYDYFPLGFYQRFVRENDTVVTCASYSGALLVFMRRHIGILFGDGYNETRQAGDWTQDFLDTTNGCLNSKTVQTVTYPDGRQEIFYLSDNGVHAVYTLSTLALDNSARYSTRSMTEQLIDWSVYESVDWSRAAAHFLNGRYWLVFPDGATWKGLVFNADNSQWYPIDNIVANNFYHDEDYFYYAGDAGHLRVFDKELFGDYDDAAATTGTPINAYWYSKLMTPRLTGYDHLWDVIMIEARQFYDTSSIDLEVNTFRNQFTLENAVASTIFIIGKTPIGKGKITNTNFSDFINNAERLDLFVSGQYVQTKLSNDKYEPFEVFNITYEVREMTKY